MTTGDGFNPSDPTSGPQPGDAPDLVEAFFDRELDPALTRDLLSDLRNDPARSEEIARTQRMLSLLRRTPAMCEQAEENLLESVLARVEQRRRFLPESWRRIVTAGRLCAAASVVLGALGVAVLGRADPDLLRLRPQPAPMGALIDHTRAEVTSSAARIAVTFEAISEHAAAPLMQLRLAAVEETGPMAESAPLDASHAGDAAFERPMASAMVIGGSGDAAALKASFLGAELGASRQRSGDSAPVFQVTLRAETAARAKPSMLKARVPRGSGGALPVSCQSLTIGDHTVVVPAGLESPGWVGGSRAVERLLLIQAYPSDQFPSR